MTDWKATMVQRFNDAAPTYDAGAACQHRIAQALCQDLVARNLGSVVHGLEIGCGTGHLTRSLLPAFPDTHWLITDIAPAMVARCADCSGPRTALRVLDGERPDLGTSRFDLVTSSLAVQWFESLVTGLERLHGLLKPSGLLAITTLGSETFREWRDLCQSEGLEPATPNYPSREALAEALGPSALVTRRPWPMAFPGLRGFLDHLRIIGANTAAPGQRPLPPHALRRLLGNWKNRPFTATYDVLTLFWKKEP